MNYPICDTMLCVYKDLVKACDKLDELSLQLAVKSMTMNTYDVVDKLLEYNREKEACCNVKVIIDTALEQLDRKHELKAYIKGLSYERIAKRFFIEEDEAIARVEEQKEKLSKIILLSNDIRVLQEIISSCKWFNQIFSSKLRQAKKLSPPTRQI